MGRVPNPPHPLLRRENRSIKPTHLDSRGWHGVLPLACHIEVVTVLYKEPN